MLAYQELAMITHPVPVSTTTAGIRPAMICAVEWQYNCKLTKSVVNCLDEEPF